MYASEVSINKTIQPLKEQGLCHYFHLAPVHTGEAGQPGFTSVELRVHHAKSGGVLTSSRIIPDWDPTVGKIDKRTGEFKMDLKHQQTGAAISYAKRYLLADMFGIATEENEGETTVAPEEAPKGAKAKPQPVTPTKAKTPVAPPAPPAADPLAESKTAITAALTEKHESLNKNPVFIAEWRKHVKHRWNGNIKVAENHIKVEHLTTPEMLADTKEWIENYSKVPQA